MILLVAVFSLHQHTTHHCVGFFLTILCVFFVFRLAFCAFSSFSSSVVPFLTQLHPSSLTQHAQLISHNSSPLTTYITHLTQLISHNSTHKLISLNSSHTTQLSQELLSCGIWWSCFHVLSLNFTQVLSHNSSHNSHNSSHTTLKSCFRVCSCSIWWSFFRVAGSALAAAGVAFVWQGREFDSLQAAARGAPGAASVCYGDCRRSLGLNMTQPISTLSIHLTQLNSLNSSHSAFLTQLHSTHLTYLTSPSCHATHLTQLISTHLTQLTSLNSPHSTSTELLELRGWR